MNSATEDYNCLNNLNNPQNDLNFTETTNVSQSISSQETQNAQYQQQQQQQQQEAQVQMQLQSFPQTQQFSEILQDPHFYQQQYFEQYNNLQEPFLPPYSFQYNLNNSPIEYPVVIPGSGQFILNEQTDQSTMLAAFNQNFPVMESYPMVDVQPQSFPGTQQLGLSNMKYFADPNFLNISNHQPQLPPRMPSASALSLNSQSPQSNIFDPHTACTSSSSLSSAADFDYHTNDYAAGRLKVIRGVSSGGSATKPPKIASALNHHYLPINLEVVGASLDEVCLPRWNEGELAAKRRIIRIERRQIGSKLVASFSIVHEAEENPTTLPLSQPGVDFVEVSCLECFVRPGDDLDRDELNEDETKESRYKNSLGPLERVFYITSVEVVRIIELLIGTDGQEPAERSRERGRIRSNLVSYWSKKPIKSKQLNSDSRITSSHPEDLDFRIELATRIMAYEDRKPRGFDKEVRILKWEKLIASLHRALQSYYVEFPDELDEHNSL